MSKFRRLLCVPVFLFLTFAALAADNVSTLPPDKDTLTPLVANTLIACKAGRANCLHFLNDEDDRRASNASSVTVGLFGSTAKNSAYEDDTHYYRYKVATDSTGNLYKVGVGFHIAANLKDADLSLVGSANGIGLEAKPNKGKVQLRIDLLGIDYADDKNNLYSAVPIAIELESESIKKLGSALSDRVKIALNDQANAKLYICPQVVAVLPRESTDQAKKVARDRALAVQVQLNAICDGRFPNATMRFTDDVQSVTGGLTVPGIGGANASQDSNIVFQEYRRYRYTTVNQSGEEYGAIDLIGAKMYLTGLNNTANLTSIAAALFSASEIKSAVSVQYLGYGINKPGLMLSDIAGTQIGQPTYVVNVYNAFRRTKDEVDLNADITAGGATSPKPPATPPAISSPSGVAPPPVSPPSTLSIPRLIFEDGRVNQLR